MKMELPDIFYRFVDQYTCTLSSFSSCMKRIYLSVVCFLSVLWQNVHHGKNHDNSVVGSIGTSVHCE
jgi:hypothetical protein